MINNLEKILMIVIKLNEKVNNLVINKDSLEDLKEDFQNFIIYQKKIKILNDKVSKLDLNDSKNIIKDLMDINLYLIDSITFIMDLEINLKKIIGNYEDLLNYTLKDHD